MGSSSPAAHTSLDEIFSDESSFYGDEAEKSRLEDLVADYDPKPYWSEIQPRLLSTIQHEYKTVSLAQPGDPMHIDENENAASDGPRLDSYQRAETVSGFLARLPPSTTKTESVGPWIRARNPKQPTDDGDVAALVRRGRELLFAFEDEQARLQAEHDKSGKAKGALTRKLNPLRKTLEKDLFALARETGVVSGKWMMFPTADRVDAIWEAVAGATVRGTLGIEARVATDDGSGGERLICVYTRDYEDREDIKRVLMKLRDLGLVNREERPIYYKCDALTYLEIKSNNPYGLKASFLSSRDLLT